MFYEPENLARKTPKSEMIKKIILRTFISAILAFILYKLTTFFFLSPVVLTDSSMSPNIEKGSRAYVTTWFDKSSLQPGDIVLFNHPYQKEALIISRIVALPGDSIAMKNKILYRNRKKLSLDDKIQHSDTRKALSASLSGRDNREKSRIPAGHYFVISDNRDEALDSREFGPIAAQNIVGKVLF